MATIFAAPAAFAAWTAHKPTGPSPSTAAQSPGRMPAWSTACQPVPITSPANSATSSDMPSGTLRSVRLAWGTSTCSACAPWSEPSVLPCPNTRPSSHWWKSPRRQKKQLAARGAVTAEYTVALGDLGHAFAGRGHGAHELVPEREAGFDGHPAVVDVQIRAADAGGLHAHHRVVALQQLGLGPLLDSNLAGSLEGDRLHRSRRLPCPPLSESFYRVEGEHVVPTELTRGPWDPGAQHAGPPSALIARALESCEPREGMQIGRVTVEILRPVPLEPLRVSAQVVRPGRSVELLEASLSAAGGELMRARGWRSRDRCV